MPGIDIRLNTKNYILKHREDGSKILTRPVQQFVNSVKDTGRTRPEDVSPYETFIHPDLTGGFGRQRINSDRAFDPNEYRRFWDSTLDTRWQDAVYLPILAETAGKDHSSTDTTDMSVVKNSASFKGELNALWTGPGGTVLNKRFTGSSTNAWENGGLIHPFITSHAISHQPANSSHTFSVTIPVGTDLFVAVLMGTDNTTIGTSDPGTVPSIGGSNMTKAVSNAEGNNAVQIWYAISPSSGSQNFSVAWLDTTTNNIAEPTYKFYSIQGANTSAISVATANSDMSSTTSVSNTVTTAIGDIVIDGYAVNDDVTNTAGADQLYASLSSASNSFTHVSTLKIATTTSTTMTHTMSEAESGCSAAAAFAILPTVPLDMTSDRGNLVALVAHEDDHLVYTSSDADNSSWTAATTQLTAGLLDNSVTVDENIDAGLFATIGGELIACLWDEGTGVTFFRSTNGGVAWADEAVDIPSANGPQGVAVYVGIDGEDKLYVATHEGIYEVDTSPSTWTYQLIFPMSGSDDNGRRMTVHSGSLWFAQGVDNDSPAPIYRMTVQGNSRIFETGFGLDVGDGVPSDMLGPVRDMKSTGDQLFISVGGGAADRKARILSWSGIGWHHMTRNTTANQKIEWIDVGSGDDGTPRLHFAERTATSTSIAKFLEQPLVNPRSGVSIKREDDSSGVTGYVDLPYIDLGMPHENKNFLRAHVNGEDLNSSAADEYITIQYGTDDDARTTTALGNYTSANTVNTFVSNAGKSGKNIGMRVNFLRGSTNTNSPKLKDLIVEGMIVPGNGNLSYQHEITIDIDQTATATGLSTESVYSNLKTLLATVTQVDFEFGAESRKVTVDRDNSAFLTYLDEAGYASAPNSMATRRGILRLVLVERIPLT